MKISTYEELAKWIKTNIGLDDDNTIHKNILWFVAMKEARMFCQDIKNLASAIQDGIGPINKEYVSEWLEQQNDLEEDTEDEEFSVENQLRGFFGI